MKTLQSRKTALKILFIFMLLTSAACAQNGRDRWQEPARVMDSLGVVPGMVIGEVGAGDGYFTFHLAERVGDSGLVYANDIDDEELDEIRDRTREDSLTNIKVVLGEITETNFPDSTMEMVIMVYVFHHLEEPIPFFRNLTRTLKSGAPVVILERDPKKFNGRSGHFFEQEKILDILRETGYRVEKIYTFLVRDNIYVTYVPSNPSGNTVH